MNDMLKKKNAILFAGGILFGTAGVKILSGKDAKKFYTWCTVAVLRAKDFVMDTVTSVQENAEDILAEAKQINEVRAKEEDWAEDEADDTEEIKTEEISGDAEISADQTDYKEEAN